MDKQDGGYGLLLAFDSEDREFSRGFEAGRIFGTLAAHPEEEINETVHAVNTEMFMRMGEALNRPVRSEDLDETWIEVTFSPAQEGSDDRG